jgi:hypothetical protein
MAHKGPEFLGYVIRFRTIEKAARQLNDTDGVG